MRISKDGYHFSISLNIAKSVAIRSPCLRRKYGAIIVKNDSIVSTGYNGPARGSINCEEVGCIKEALNLPHYSAYDYCPAVHAEGNAVINAARNGSSVLNGTLYLYGIDAKTGEAVPGMPCPRCKRVLINVEIVEVVTIDESGKIVHYRVKDWIEDDKRNYINLFKEKVKE